MNENFMEIWLSWHWFKRRFTCFISDLYWWSEWWEMTKILLLWYLYSCEISKYLSKIDLLNVWILRAFKVWFTFSRLSANMLCYFSLEDLLGVISAIIQRSSDAVSFKTVWVGILLSGSCNMADQAAKWWQVWSRLILVEEYKSAEVMW